MTALGVTPSFLLTASQPLPGEAGGKGNLPGAGATEHWSSRIATLIGQGQP